MALANFRYINALNNNNNNNNNNNEVDSVTPSVTHSLTDCSDTGLAGTTPALLMSRLHRRDARLHRDPTTTFVFSARGPPTKPFIFYFSLMIDAYETTT